MAKTHLMLLAPILGLFCLQSTANGVYLSSSFRDEGEDGLHLAYSFDGYNWTALNNDETFTPTQKFFDPVYSVIDAAIVQHGAQCTMVFKDERDSRKRLKMVTANDITPGSFDGHAIFDLNARVNKYVEGPSPIKIGNNYFVYYDHYTYYFPYPQYYGALRSSDMVNWTDVSSQISFPADTRHGTVFEAPDSVLGKLLPLPNSPPLCNGGFENSMNGIFDLWDYGGDGIYVSNGSVVQSTDGRIWASRRHWKHPDRRGRDKTRT